MPTPRGLLSAAPGPNGKLYAIGGSNGSGDLATVEEFTPPAGPSLVPPSPVAAATPTGTPGTTGLTAAQALAQAQGLGLTPGSGQCAPVGGACTGNAPNLQVRGTVISSMNWTVTATLPLAPASGAGQPIFVVTTTAGREAVPCGPVLPVAPAPGAQVSCAATTTGHALLGAASFLIFAGMGGAPGPAAGPALITGPGVAAASPTVPPAVAGLPVLSPPPPIILPPPPLPLIPAPPQAIAPVGLPTALGPAPEVPIIPEADSLVLLAGGLAGLVATALLRARRRR